jgi:uncharacterized protein DUF6356
MQIRGLFTSHPASVGETYGEHMRVALSFAAPLAKAAGAALVHAFLPFLFTTTASLTVKSLYAHDPPLRRLPQGGSASARSHGFATARFVRPGGRQCWL